MSKSCCGKPLAKIIKVGTFDAGIVGLDAVLRDVSAAGVGDDEQVKAELLRLTKEYGNYIAPGTEADYTNALFREYRKYAVEAEREGRKA